MNNSEQIGKQILHVCTSTECRWKHQSNNILRPKNLWNIILMILHLIVLEPYVVELNNQ